MSDLISRQAATDAIPQTSVDVFENCRNCKLLDREQVVEILESLPSADRPTGWIPVSERLPDIGDTFLVTVMVGKEIRTDVADSFGSYIDGFWDTFNDWIEDEECHVIAWMPLPEPYKGGDSDG